MPDIPSCSFYGLKISIFTNDLLIDYIDYIILNNFRVVCYGYSLGLLTLFSKFPQIYELSEEFDLMLADGRAFYWLANIAGCNLKSDLSIPRFVHFCLELANQKGFSIQLYGATKESNQKANDEIQKKYPHIVIKKGIDGFGCSERQVIQIISDEQPDILLIGLPSPLKEEFAAKCKNILPCKVIIPCGGVIDTLSGKTVLTPLWLKRLGLAWLFRFIQQPKQRYEITKNTLLRTIRLIYLLWLRPKKKKLVSIPRHFGYLK